MTILMGFNYLKRRFYLDLTIKDDDFNGI
jgi:hypothetical protein